MVTFRDLYCAHEVDVKSKLGCYEESFTIYGCAFRTNGRIHYMATGKENTMATFQVDCLLKGIYPTNVRQQTTRTLVASGQWEALKQQLKLALITTLRGEVSSPFFDALDIVAQTPANDTAAPYLLAMQEALEGRFDQSLLTLYQGAAQRALKRKVLLPQSYDIISQWIGRNHQQMMDETLNKTAYTLHFTGFAYQMPAEKTISYYLNAQNRVAKERQQTLINQGYLVTPLLEQTYWLTAGNSPMAFRNNFEQILHAKLNPAYLALLQAIDALPPVVDTHVFQEQLALVKTYGSTTMVQTLLAYGQSWGIPTEIRADASPSVSNVK